MINENAITEPDSLTLRQAVELFLNHGTMRDDEPNYRDLYSLKRVVEFFSEETAVEEIGAPVVRAYMEHRKAAGAANSTVNRDIATLSNLFTVLEELRRVDQNPCRLLKRLSTKASKRQVYISYSDAVKIFTLLPDWFRPVAQTVYYTGMRVGEAFWLRRDMVDLDRRMIFLGPHIVKEDVWKKIPVHRELLPVLDSCLTATTRSEDRLFVIRDRTGVRLPSDKRVKSSWRKACAEMNFCPSPRLADLRHTWKRNAEGSGVDDCIARRIMGHSMMSRWDDVQDSELLEAIDRLTFEHGKTYMGIVA